MARRGAGNYGAGTGGARRPTPTRRNSHSRPVRPAVRPAGDRPTGRLDSLEHGWLPCQHLRRCLPLPQSRAQLAVSSGDNAISAVFSSKNQNSKKKILAPAWRLKSRRNKKCIATAACKSRDESNEPN